ncbi:MAG: TonB-dependent receptor [Chitinophagaceae bacterium]|nr:MAG: TonB-dependent receptor [Chitinophagaceae bacterium]
MLKRILFLLVIGLAVNSISAQVTTSAISGTVKTSDGSGLAGATVTAIHLPTGTNYTTLSRTDGGYNIVNMVPGGPYKVEITFVGFQTYSQTNISLPLGENTRFDADLSNNNETLAAVVVTGTGTTKRKTGASTSVSREQINALPTLSRSLSDFTRLTPQANGNSFGGASNRFNNITIDGAVNNDVFGLSGSGTPGGQAATTPISLDAIQEIQVVLAPYDITYGNFTGAGVNAVTRSGTNNVEGSAYYFYRNQNTIGKDPVSRVKSTKFSDKQYGLRVGAPIIKNKLFIFANVELARRTAPTIFNAGDNNAVLTTAAAQALAADVQARYGYDVGSFDAINAETQSDKIFARIDWNINSKHSLVARHNYISAFDDNISRSATLFRFGNNTYRFNNEQNISVVELRSRFSNRFSNNLIVGVHRIRDSRSTLGTPFPSVEIFQGSGTIQFGSERSSTANELDQDIFEVTDNFKIFKGKHTFTIGTHNEFFKFRNLFINNLSGRWRFANIADFNANQPRQFDVTFSADKTANPRPSAEFKAAQLGFYAQDEFQVNTKFKLTYGIRVDVPQVITKPAYNRAVDSTFNGAYSTSNTPDGQLLFAPRVGFNYDVDGDRKLIVRGGAGIFSGRVPFVWLSNQFSNTGLLLRTTSETDNTPNAAPYTVNNGNGFVSDVNQQSNIGAAGNTYEVNLIDKKFKLPQVFRVNLAADAKLPGGINATFEAIYSKTINNVFYQDVNLTAPTGVVNQAYNNGADQRIAFGSSNALRRVNQNFTNAILISNTNKGYTTNLGVTLNKTAKNFFVQASYNYNIAQDVNSGASSTALSNWEFVQVVGSPNEAGLANSNYQLKHRITGIFSYSVEYLKHLKSSISFFYSGNSGQAFTYLVNGDLNSDGRFGNDLLYVPNDASEIRFVDLLNSAGNTVLYTAAEQSALFLQFVDNDPYLKKMKGNYTERNGRNTPWEHVIDARFTQDFFIMTGTKKHDLQFTFDVFNLTNLIDKGAGRQYAVTNQAYSILTAVSRTGGIAPGTGYNFTPGQTPWSMSFGSRFQGQVGLRYTFN